MMDRRMCRAHLRAPSKYWALYHDDGHALKCRTVNISEGGVLLAELPHVPEINAIPLMLKIPQFPPFASLGPERVKAMSPEDIKDKIIRTRAKIVRSFDGKSDVDLVFVQHIGCQFVNLDDESQEVIRDYVSLFAKNIIYLLNLFESMGKKQDNLIVLRRVARLLGYREEEKIALLRQKVLHDYQSLESL